MRGESQQRTEHNNKLEQGGKTGAWVSQGLCDGEVVDFNSMETSLPRPKQGTGTSKPVLSQTISIEI